MRKYDWDAMAGVAAAVAALILHMFHVVEADILLSITVVLVAVLLLRQIRQEGRDDRVDATTARTELLVTRPRVGRDGSPLPPRRTRVAFRANVEGVNCVWRRPDRDDTQARQGAATQRRSVGVRAQH